MRFILVAGTAAVLLSLTGQPGGAQTILPQAPVAFCERVGPDVLVGSSFGGSFASHVLRKAGGDLAADCNPERRPDDRFLGEEAFRCLHGGTSLVIARSSSDEVGERFILRRSDGGDEMADCDPAPREGDIKLNDDLERAAYAVRVLGDLFYYESSTGPQGGLTLHDIASGETLVDLEEGVGVSLTGAEFVYYARLAEAEEADCPEDFAAVTAGTGAAGLYVRTVLTMPTGSSEEFETACLTEQ